MIQPIKELARPHLYYPYHPFLPMPGIHAGKADRRQREAVSAKFGSPISSSNGYAKKGLSMQKDNSYKEG